MQIKQNFSTKIKLFQECFSLCSVSAAEDLDYCKRKKKYLLRDLVFVSSSGLWFAAVKYGTGISL